MLKMMAVPGGIFRMGSHLAARYPDESPQHSVRVRSFFIAQNPITQAQRPAVMGWLPPCRCPGGDNTAYRISWTDASGFYRALSGKTGWQFDKL